MEIDAKIARRIVKNVLLSLFIYGLPILLMLVSFYFSGQRPWLKKENKEHVLIKK